MLAILESRKDLDRRLIQHFDSGHVDPELVSSILSVVRNLGDQALKDLTLKFDKVGISSFAVSQEKCRKSAERLDPYLKSPLMEAAENIRIFHEAQVPKPYGMEQKDGTKVDWRWRPIQRVAVYVPGGSYPLLSTLLMNVIPAQVAGVKEIVVCTPPGENGYPHESILAACDFLGIKEIYQVGGAQAIAALAYGTESIPAVDKITGPGNAYVTAAKQAVASQVGIDMMAGPTEIVIIADETANPKFIAADLISQAEHDENATAILLTDSQETAKDVTEVVMDLYRQVSTKELVKKSLKRNGFIYVADSIQECVEISNRIAPEHLSLQVGNPEAIVDELIAGAIFLGSKSPVAWGDYWAGPNHTLPTMGHARFRGPLNALDFMTPYSIIDASKAVSRSAESVLALAKAEGLDGHALSVELRRGES